MKLVNADCIEWLSTQPANSIQAVCTDPPYGIVEYSEHEIAKLRKGRGGVWRLPPAFDGKVRKPLPRFSVLNEKQRVAVGTFFEVWARALLPTLVPGAHVLVASNPLLQSYVYQGLLTAGLEGRGSIIRVYHGFRGGDRPKLAEKEFPDVCVSPRGNHEPWLLFRKPISEKTVAANLRKWGTGGMRMFDGGKPIPDLVPSFKTPVEEKNISDHPSLKPQHLMRIFCRMLLPTPGILLDPFMGSGSTIAACEALGIDSIGIELDEHYFGAVESTIPKLKKLLPDFKGERLTLGPKTAPMSALVDELGELELF
jgi:site-specific DNA-methyltransferase (adenine-specific)